MNTKTLLGLLTAGALIGTTTYSSVIEVFTDVAPTGLGNGAFVNWDDKTPPSDYTGQSGEGIAATSPIGRGPAVQIWDHRTDARALFRYDFDTPLTEPFQFEFNALIDTSLTPAGVDQFLSFAFGNAGESVEAGNSRQGFQYRFYPNGDLGVNGPTAVSNLPLDTAFSLAVVLNPSTTSSVNYDVGGSSVSLGAAQYAVYLNGSLLVTDGIRADESNWAIADGFGRVAVSTGSIGDLTSTMFFDDWFIKTGSDIGIAVVPEPEAFAALIGALTFGFMFIRRRRS